MRRWLIVPLVLAAATLPPRPLGAQAAEARHPASGQAPGQTGTSGKVDLGVSLERIKKELEQVPPLPAEPLRLDKLPTFRVEVFGARRPLLPKFSETLNQAWQPVVPGGIYNKEILDMITPPQARPFGQSVDGELAQVVTTAVINALVGRGIVQGYRAGTGALRSWREQRIHEEVSAELAAFLLANSQRPESQPDEKKPPGKKRPEKKPEGKGPR